MGLAVDTPTQPDLTNRPLPTAVDPEGVVDATGDLRRGELEGALRDGAWADAFREWAEYTDLSDEEYAAIHDAGLFQELDVFWHPDEQTIEFELPSIPDRVDGDAGLASRAATELADLGETVTRVLEDDYIAWDEPEIDDEEPEEL